MDLSTSKSSSAESLELIVHYNSENASSEPEDLRPTSPSLSSEHTPLNIFSRSSSRESLSEEEDNFKKLQDQKNHRYSYRAILDRQLLEEKLLKIYKLSIKENQEVDSVLETSPPDHFSD